MCAKFHVLRMRRQWFTDISNLQIMVQSWYGCHRHVHISIMCTYVCSSVTCTKKIDLRHVGGGWGENYAVVDTCIV